MRKTTERFVSSRRTRRLALAAVCLSTVFAGGCKSSMPTLKAPSWSSFGFKREPSPDAIAGVGPTATYPLSPSATATPNAIQSVAASPSGMQPQTSQVASSGLTRPTAVPATTASGPQQTPPSFASSPNPSAAAANGFATKAPTGPAVAPGTSYVYGKNPGVTPPSGQSPATPTYATPGTTVRPPASNYAAVGYPLPGSSPSTPPPTGPVSASLSSPPPAVPTSAATGSPTPPSLAGGFAMPPGTAPSGQSPSTSPVGGFVMPTGSPVAQSSTIPSAGGFVMPSLGGKPVESSSAPLARTASVATKSSAPSPSGVTPAGGYAPGSTSGATGYPATSAGGTGEAGTFYR